MDGCRKGSAAGFPIQKPAEHNGLIRLLAGGGIFCLAGSAAGKKSPHFVHIYRKARRQAIDDGANGGAVRLPENRNLYIFAKN